MKYFDWDEEKNAFLKALREISFEDVQTAIEEGRVLDEFEHPNKKRYPNQRIFIVEIDNYAYYVPYVEDEEKIFLKTIFPSRKATKKYLYGGEKK
ncbi:toxin [Candidatus Daviesbacteria bacterium RIFCSPHIGHO2_02_FULL_39_12]|uniref:Toxin n=1 Tax=Candidatus Daviesbacteria bacterium RIFCSPHIGHO2_02_FULL_39_12 TaxID=1797770 RepID=A0A1F5JDA9_9BACT|nr:MAG: toxin [Candidatus Daviesbacteria bacterium RIFCSPHIGHO2_02_FULL_39_12]